jgi:hypothetical protein
MTLLQGDKLPVAMRMGFFVAVDGVRRVIAVLNRILSRLGGGFDP